MKKEYQVRINRVLQYIEANLNRNLSLTEVAEASHFSVYHFHRIFKAIIGETVNDYIARRRLENAVNLLIFKKDLSVTQVALDSGFSSSANFSKAVKLHFGYSPSEIRNPDKIKDSKIGKLFSKYGKAFNPADLYPSRSKNEAVNTFKREDINMNVEIKKLDTLRVCTMASEQGYEPESIYRAWDKLINWAENLDIEESEQKRFALAFDNPTVTPIGKCRYLASVVVDKNIQINPPFEESEIPGGQYAVLYFKGQPEEALDAQLSLYGNWMSESGFEPDDFPMMEHYLNDARVDGYVEMEVYVKLKAL